jgi:hypothetical protein
MPQPPVPALELLQIGGFRYDLPRRVEPDEADEDII